MDKAQASNPQYFEGTLQLRNCKDDVVSFARRLTLKHPRAFISKEKKVQGGVDFFLSDNKFLRSLGKKIQESFVGELKVTATLHTKDKQKSKDLYRLTVMFRQLSFTKGDILDLGGDDVEVIRITNNDVLVKHVKSGKKEHISLQKAEAASPARQ